VTTKVVTEEQLRERLRLAGKADEEIEELIDQYAGASRGDLPDESAISRILQRTQQESILRVQSFKLTKQQYDALLGHYQEVGAVPEGQQAEASLLVQKALEDTVDLIS